MTHSDRKQKQWFEGNHQGFITDELFEDCQAARQELSKVKHSPSTLRTYLLSDRVYCARCVGTKPPRLADTHYGKMRPGWDRRRNHARYRCLARDRGYHSCEQGYISTDWVDEQVIEALSSLVIPDGYQERIEAAVRGKMEHAEALKKMAEIEEIMKRIDFSWEQGFLSPQDYIVKRNQFQREMESLRPVDYDDAIEAADLLGNFRTYWEGCEKVNNPVEARKQLLSKIVDRVFVYDDRVIAVALHGDFGVVLGDETVAPHDIIAGLSVEMKKGASSLENSCTQYGSDGLRHRSGHKCIFWFPRGERYRMMIQVVVKGVVVG